VKQFHHPNAELHYSVLSTREKEQLKMRTSHYIEKSWCYVDFSAPWCVKAKAPVHFPGTEIIGDFKVFTGAPSSRSAKKTRRPGGRRSIYSVRHLPESHHTRFGRTHGAL
jgi:hypothetical protein